MSLLDGVLTVEIVRDLYLAGLRRNFRRSVLKSFRQCGQKPWQDEAVESDRPSREARKPLKDGHNHQHSRKPNPTGPAPPIIAVPVPCHLLGQDGEGVTLGEMLCHGSRHREKGLV